jgi:hypothetical protein
MTCKKMEAQAKMFILIYGKNNVHENFELI